MNADLRAIAAPGPIARQKRGRTKAVWSRFSLTRRLIGPLVVVAAWAVATSAGWIDPSVLPSPTVLGRTFLNLWSEHALAAQVAVSLGRALTGGLVGAALGLLLGVAAGLTRLGEE